MNEILKSFAVLSCIVVLVAAGSPDSINDLKKHLRRVQEGGGCFKVLSTEGEFGCEALSEKKVPLTYLSRSTQRFSGNRILVMELGILSDFLELVLSDEELKERVKGIAVLPPENGGYLDRLSFGNRFPNAEFPNRTFPYSDREYSWNPAGTGLRFQSYPFPIFVIEEDRSEGIREAAKRNLENVRESFVASTSQLGQGGDDAATYGEINMDMYAKENSIKCIEEKECQPIGGHSVLGIYPSDLDSGEETILVITGIDTAGLILDRAKGAESPTGGLITMLTAIDILSAALTKDNLPKKKIAFAALVGEPWDYMGSRRLIAELTPGGRSVFGDSPPLNLEEISKVNFEPYFWQESMVATKVIEIGQVGNPEMENDFFRFYAHGDSAAIQRTFLQEAEDSKIDLKSASETNPGLPPSSLMTWLSINASLEGVVLTDFDTHFRNSHFESFLDRSISGTYKEALTVASILLAKTVFKLATTQTLSKIDEEEVRGKVSSLIGCLLSGDEAVYCNSESDFPVLPQGSNWRISKIDHYPGVILPPVGENSQSLDYTKKDLEVFIYNYMASRLSEKREKVTGSIPCRPYEDQCSKEKICIEAEDGSGYCADRSVFFVPSYSLSLHFVPCQKGTNPCGWQLSQTSEIEKKYSWSPDRIWTESDWKDNPSLAVYLKDSRETEINILVSGIAISALTILISLISRSVFNKAAHRS